MTERAPDGPDLERSNRAIGRAGLGVAVAALVAGTGAALVGVRPASVVMLQIAFGVLIVMPLSNVVAVLTGEVRRRDWGFVLLAVGVAVVLGFNVWDRLHKL